MTHKCNGCSLDLDRDRFWPSSLRKQDFRCKVCASIRHKKDRLRRLKDNHIHERFRFSKNSAKGSGKPFKLTFDEYSAVASKPCYYCEEKKLENDIGLDRIDNDKAIGYTVDNILPCCSDCNKIRNNLLTVEEAKIAITAVINYRKSKLPR